MNRLLLALSAVVFVLPIVSAAEQPNILFVLTDDQGWWDVGMRGNEDIDTPVMDRLSREGVDFHRFYAAPVCAPTRAGLMTGRYCFRTGLYNTRFGGDTLGIGEVTIAEHAAEGRLSHRLLRQMAPGQVRSLPAAPSGLRSSFWATITGTSTSTTIPIRSSTTASPSRLAAT